MNFTFNFLVPASASRVYESLTHQIGDWWTRDIDGAALQTGDEFTVRFGKTTKTFRVQAIEKYSAITWQCLSAYIDYDPLQKKDEWVGTTIIWRIVPTEETGVTAIRMEHAGLTPRMECYEICESGWKQFLENLQQFLTTGRGLPYQKAQ